MGNTEITFDGICNEDFGSLVKYVAMDNDGEVYGYSVEPTVGDSMWVGGGICLYLGTVDVGGLDWRHTLLKVGSPLFRKAALMLEEVRTMGRPRKENTPAFDLEAALAGAPVKLRGGGKAYIRFVEREYETDFPVVGILGAGGPAIVALWRECGRYIDSDTESPCDIVGMWQEPAKTKVINGHEIPDISFTPEATEGYCFPAPGRASLYGVDWFFQTDENDVHRLRNNMCYPATDEGKAAAIAHAKALLGDQCE